MKMLVENPEAFKAWLVTVLEPLCDADPVALSKYVYALVKKDKPTDELKATMNAQLEVFLQKETSGFIDFLFTKLESGLKDEYTYMIKVKEEPLEQPGVTTSAISDSGQTTISAEISPTASQTSQASQEQEVVRKEPSADSVNNSKSVSSDPLEIVQQEPELNDQVPPEETPKLRNGSLASTSKTLDRQNSSSRSRDRKSDSVPPEETPELRNGSLASTSKTKTLDRQNSSSRSRDRKSDSEREEKDRSYSLRRRNSSGSPPRRQERSRSRSRSRSRETHRRSRRSPSRSRRSRSRGRDRSWRNKSPPRRYDRKLRSWSRSPERSISRSPPLKTRYSKYKIRTPSPHGTRDSPTKSGGGTPRQDLGHGDDLHLSQSSLHSAVNVTELFSKKQRCRDYEEKGVCLVGDYCPFDHGNDPVVLDDVGQVLSFSGPGASCLEQPSPAMGMPMLQPAHTPGIALLQPPQIMNRPPPNLSEYNPDAPSMEPRIWSKQPFRNPGRGMVRPGGPMRPPLVAPHHQRELISVPTEGENEPFYSNLTLGNSTKRQCPSEFTLESDVMSAFTKPRFDYGRLGVRKGGNCSLHLKKIPPGLNNIAHLHNHFVKFGKIVNIQVNFEGDLEAALITFTSHAEASAAYKSTEAVLNNRFIKVFWHTPEEKQENISPMKRPSAKERLGIPVNLIPASSIHKENIGNDKIKISGTNITKTFYNVPSSELKKRRTVSVEDRKVIITTKIPPQVSQETLNAREALRKRKDELQKEALSKTQELSQLQRDFLDKLLLRHCELNEKLEKGKFSAGQRAEIAIALTELQESIDVVRKGIESKAPTKPGPSTTQKFVNLTSQSVKESIEKTKKEILDAELDLITQHRGKDGSEINKTITELKTKAHFLGKLAKKNLNPHRLSRGGVHSNRSLSYGGRGAFNPHSTVDHRPTKLLVSGFESDDKAEVLEHFSTFGEVTDHIWDEATPAIVIQFKTRKDAETAMAKGRNFQDRLMSVTWFSATQTIGTRNSEKRSVVVLNEKVDELLPEVDEEDEALKMDIDKAEDLLLQDEEEEENDEDRTWRR